MLLLMMRFSGLERGSKDLLPVADGLVFCGGRERGIDRIAGIERRIDDGVGLGARVEAADIVLAIDRVDDLAQ
jgi:hypothetical protein